jgi:hypothetical protein
MHQRLPIPLLIEDAIAFGYRVIVFVVDDEAQRLWCASCQTYSCPCFGVLAPEIREGYIDPNHGHDHVFILETEREELELELDAEFDEPHDTWFDPANPDAVVEPDGACYCGWLGISPPPAEFAPPGCSCVADDSGETVRITVSGETVRITVSGRIPDDDDAATKGQGTDGDT